MNGFHDWDNDFPPLQEKKVSDDDVKKGEKEIRVGLLVVIGLLISACIMVVILF